MTMDLTIVHKKQEVMHTQSRLTDECENPINILNNTFEETDVKENNNLFNSLKTETNNDDCLNAGSLIQDGLFDKEKKLEEGNSLLIYSSIKKAIDLSTHNRTPEGRKRTIFDDAEYFAKNHSYKLLPITLESVDEAIIHTEHNYCNLSLSSGSDVEEDCSRTMDYSQIKEKNYKKRKAKTRAENIEDKSDNDCKANGNCNGSFATSLEEERSLITESTKSIIHSEPESTYPVEPLDLSAPLVQEQKTDHCLRDHHSYVNNKVEKKEDSGQSDSDKENVKSKLGCIEVTITGPDEKENYEPCDLFLNDVARLVPKLIKKDCFEIDILDRTCDRYVDVQKHRLYYIISESTWRLFQSTNERVVLTNDPSLGQPVQKTDRNDRPTFLIFDQFSLAKCLADYCKEIGGCFEYTCVEETKEGAIEARVSEKDMLESLYESKGIPLMIEQKKEDDFFCTKTEKQSESVNDIQEGEKLEENLDEREGNVAEIPKEKKDEVIEIIRENENKVVERIEEIKEKLLTEKDEKPLEKDEKSLEKTSQVEDKVVETVKQNEENPLERIEEKELEELRRIEDKELGELERIEEKELEELRRIEDKELGELERIEDKELGEIIQEEEKSITKEEKLLEKSLETDERVGERLEENGEKTEETLVETEEQQVGRIIEKEEKLIDRLIEKSKTVRKKQMDEKIKSIEQEVKKERDLAEILIGKEDIALEPLEVVKSSDEKEKLPERLERKKPEALQQNQSVWKKWEVEGLENTKRTFENTHTSENDESNFDRKSNVERKWEVEERVEMEIEEMDSEVRSQKEKENEEIKFEMEITIKQGEEKEKDNESGIELEVVIKEERTEMKEIAENIIPDQGNYESENEVEINGIHEKQVEEKKRIGRNEEEDQRKRKKETEINITKIKEEDERSELHEAKVVDKDSKKEHIENDVSTEKQEFEVTLTEQDERKKSVVVEEDKEKETAPEENCQTFEVTKSEETSSDNKGKKEYNKINDGEVLEKKEIHGTKESTVGKKEDGKTEYEVVPVESQTKEKNDEEKETESENCRVDDANKHWKRKEERSKTEISQSEIKMNTSTEGRNDVKEESEVTILVQQQDEVSKTGTSLLEVVDEDMNEEAKMYEIRRTENKTNEVEEKGSGIEISQAEVRLEEHKRSESDNCRLQAPEKESQKEKRSEPKEKTEKESSQESEIDGTESPIISKKEEEGRLPEEKHESITPVIRKEPEENIKEEREVNEEETQSEDCEKKKEREETRLEILKEKIEAPKRKKRRKINTTVPETHKAKVSDKKKGKEDIKSDMGQVKETVKDEEKVIEEMKEKIPEHETKEETKYEFESCTNKGDVKVIRNRTESESSHRENSKKKDESKVPSEGNLKEKKGKERRPMHKTNQTVVPDKEIKSETFETKGNRRKRIRTKTEISQTNIPAKNKRLSEVRSEPDKLETKVKKEAEVTVEKRKNEKTTADEILTSQIKEGNEKSVEIERAGVSSREETTKIFEVSRNEVAKEKKEKKVDDEKSESKFREVNGNEKRRTLSRQGSEKEVKSKVRRRQTINIGNSDKKSELPKKRERTAEKTKNKESATKLNLMPNEKDVKKLSVISRVRTRSKSNSDVHNPSETSQSSDKSTPRRERKRKATEKVSQEEATPRKRRRKSKEMLGALVERKTRSGKKTKSENCETDHNESDNQNAGTSAGRKRKSVNVEENKSQRLRSKAGALGKNVKKVKEEKKKIAAPKGRRR